MADIAVMFDATPLLGNSVQLREQMENDGYLFFPELVDPERPLGVKNDVMSILREQFIVEDDGALDPMWSGGPHPTEREYMAAYERIVDLRSFQELARCPEIVDLLEAVCAESVHIWEQQLIRIVYPGSESVTAQGVGAHQDGDPKLGYKAVRFYTGWVALMKIDASIGGLAVAPGSHEMGLMKSVGTVASSGSASSSEHYGLDPSALSWVTAEFNPGSVVLFNNRTAHCGLPNHSNRIRLSCDFRYQPKSDSASWLAHTPGPEVRRTAQQIDEVVSGRALYVTTRVTPELVVEVRRLMLEERNTTLERAQELVRELSETS